MTDGSFPPTCGHSNGSDGNKSCWSAIAPVADIRKIVQLIDHVELVYSSEADPTCLFPLEANGRDSFVDWLSIQPGYKDRELVRAMGSTQIARFEILAVGQNDS